MSIKNNDLILFNPEGKDKFELSYVEELKKALGNRQTSNFMFTMVIDSLEQKGKIEKMEIKESLSEMIIDFKEAKKNVISRWLNL